MPTYVSLLKYTQKGAESIKQGPARIDAARQAAKAAGAEIKQIYLVMGRYDLVIISEGPDDETAAKLALAAAMQGTFGRRHYGLSPRPSSGEYCRNCRNCHTRGDSTAQHVAT